MQDAFGGLLTSQGSASGRFQRAIKQGNLFHTALAAPPTAVALALGAACAGVVVIGYWIYVLLTALQGAS